MYTQADIKPTADVEYLSSAIERDALTAKFQELFGRDPVERGIDSPMHVEDSRVPDILLESVDPQISKMLRSSAVESSVQRSGEIPPVDNSTLLYTIDEDETAKVALDSIAEYQQLDEASRDAVLAAVSEQDEINIEEGVAYVSAELANISVGIFVNNEMFAEEFSYRIENSGGNDLSSEEKTEVFDELFLELPGGKTNLEDNVRNELLSIIGLTDAITTSEEPEDVEPQAEEATPEEDMPSVEEAQEDTLEAPGADPRTQAASYHLGREVLSTTAALDAVLASEGYSWRKVSSKIIAEYDINQDDLDTLEKEYIVSSLDNAELQDDIHITGGIVEHGSIVISSRVTGIFSVLCICAGADPDIILNDNNTSELILANKNELTLY